MASCHAEILGMTWPAAGNACGTTVPAQVAAAWRVSLHACMASPVNVQISKAAAVQSSVHTQAAQDTKGFSQIISACPTTFCSIATQPGPAHARMALLWDGPKEAIRAIYLA